MKRSIRIRLMVWIMLALAPLAIGAGWLLVQVFGDRLLRDIDVALEEEAETVAQLVAKPSATHAIDGILSRIAAETNVGTSKHIIVMRGGRVVAEAPQNVQAFLSTPDPSLLVAHYRGGPPGDPIDVSIGVHATTELHAKRRLTVLLTVGVPCGLLVVGGMLWVVTGQALRPLEQASRQLEQLDVDNLSTRVQVPNRSDEVGRMVAVLNGMLDRLDESVSEMQRFNADAAHELRTPLAVLRAGLEVALAHDRTAAEYQAALAEALITTNRLCRVAEDLLTLSRLEAITARRVVTSVDLAEMLQELADAWTQTGGQQGVSIEVATPPLLSVRGNVGDLYRLFANLLENAMRHSPRGGRVVLAAHHDPGTEFVYVTIADEGPGIPDAELDRVFDRFFRGSSQRATDSGSGLGLSIVQTIARTHGGHVWLANGKSGGCVATVTLPAEPPRHQVGTFQT